jgi:uncharacterized RDD family membrane protein YckC
VNQLPPKLPDLDFAPKWQRCLHFVLDSILGYLFGYLLVLGVIAMADVSVMAAAFIEWLAGLSERRSRLFLSFFLILPYYLVFEVGCRTTPAKFITRTRVVGADGSRPSRLRLLGRTLSRLVPLEWTTFIHEANGRGWHDTASGTYVVRRADQAAADPVAAG